MTQLKESVITNTLDEDESDLFHIYCECNENVALCGFDLTNVEEIESSDGELICIVCDELCNSETYVCPLCFT